MYSLVTYTVQLNLSLHVYFISDKIVLKCVKTHASRIILKVVRDPCQKITLLLLKSKSVRVIVPESCF